MNYYPQTQYNGYSQQLNTPPQIPQQNIFLKGRPVTSLDEVRAAQIDFDGTLFLFPDIANNKIYTKQITMNGTAAINVYELSKLPVETKQEFVTKEEFNETLKHIQALLERKTPEQPTQSQQTNSSFNF